MLCMITIELTCIAGAAALFASAFDEWLLINEDGVVWRFRRILATFLSRIS